MAVNTLGAKLLEKLTPKLRQAGSQQLDQAAKPSLMALDRAVLKTAHDRNVLKVIAGLNQDLLHADPQALARKYENMAKSPARFLSGEPGVMAHDSQELVRKAGAVTAVTGDAHMNNWGTMLTENLKVKRRFNDFDEATIAPAAADFNREAVHIMLEAHGMGYSKPEALKLVGKYAKGYHDAISAMAASADGKVKIKAPPVVKQQVEDARKRGLEGWLDSRAPKHKGERMLPRNSWHHEVPAQASENLEKALEGYRRRLPPDAAKALEGYKLKDAVAVMSGTGSAGATRYEVLMQHPEREPILLQLKQQGTPSIDKFRTPPVDFGSQAERNVALSHLIDGGLDPLRGIAKLPGVEGDLLVERLSPQRRGIDAADIGSFDDLKDILRFDGAQTAKAHARGAKVGLASAKDILPTLGPRDQFVSNLQAFARDYAEQVKADYKDFTAALKHDPLLKKA